MARFTIRDYLRLIKSGIVMGNSLHYIVGVLIAVPLLWGDVVRASIGLVATALLIASACLVNNWLDRSYDKAMSRTSVRLTAAGRVSALQIYSVAGVLAVVGVVMLWLLVNPLTAILGVIAWISYSIIYTLSKRYTAWNTVIGTIPGALPALAGYTAVTGQLTTTGWWLFALIVAWQLPHFYAIAIYRRREYRAAGVKMLSTIVPAKTMYVVMVATLAPYVAAAVLLAYTSLQAVAGAILVGLALLWFFKLWPYEPSQHEAWARRQFGWSMYISLGLVLVAIVHFVASRWV